MENIVRGRSYNRSVNVKVYSTGYEMVRRLKEENDSRPMYCVFEAKNDGQQKDRDCTRLG
jgi:hypothetical protein